MFVESGEATNLDIDYSLTSDALGPSFTLQTNNDNKKRDTVASENNNGDNQDAVDNDMYDAEDEGREADWIERAWGDEEEVGDKETARVLLDALRDDAILCAVTG
ncbi:hypothetical protein NPX13_g7678 [Xylaria arbuscula]|uniref:Uncharacterized protein n=1 Tax=Xylaria arbuscula TaxID=114810 RepID=A0A9W8N9W1_9PEZI|nr:hypothetical protein NPX13_g7678 [Xylaria arbuscula]